MICMSLICWTKLVTKGGPSSQAELLDNLSASLESASSFKYTRDNPVGHNLEEDEDMHPQVRSCETRLNI